MPGLSEFGRILMVFGLILLALGALFAFGQKLVPFGRLPGDIVLRRGNFTFYFPLVTCLLLSLALTLVFWLTGRGR